MERNPIWNKITRQLNGESNRKEELDVEKWVKQDKLNRETLNRLIEIWEYNPVRLHNSPKIYQAFRNRLNFYNQRKKGNQFLSFALRYAAVLLLLISSALLINQFFPFLPGKPVTWHEIAVPKGNRTCIMLPDSSKVWISNNSKIRYPDRFANGKRELELTGEAYFEVNHDTGKPFEVIIESNRIKVLGTKFSVTAYPEESTIRADLLTGKIQLDMNTGNGNDNYQSYIVKPLNSLVYDKISGTATTSKIQEGFFDYWKNGIYVFKNESLESLAKKIERIYNIQIVFGDDFIKTKSFSGNISIDDNIFTFMEAIKRTSLEPIEYRYEDKKIVINLKSN